MIQRRWWGRQMPEPLQWLIGFWPDKIKNIKYEVHNNDLPKAICFKKEHSSGITTYLQIVTIDWYISDQLWVSMGVAPTWTGSGDCTLMHSLLVACDFLNTRCKHNYISHWFSSAQIGYDALVIWICWIIAELFKFMRCQTVVGFMIARLCRYKIKWCEQMCKNIHFHIQEGLLFHKIYVILATALQTCE